MRLGSGSTWELASSHPWRTPVLLPGKGSPKEPDDMGKVLKLLFELPNTDLVPLFSSSTFWLDKAGVKADDELLLVTGFEKIKFELEPELFAV